MPQTTENNDRNNHSTDNSNNVSGHANVYVVFGATGKQGGAAARALLRRGHRVRAVARDPRSARSAELSRQGAELVAGDMEDPRSLDAALKGAYGVFSVQTFTGPDGSAGELRQGKAVASAAARADVAHFVYSSVGGAERASGVEHFETKGRVEEHIAALGLPTTVLRPTMFIENFTGMGPVREDGELTLTLALAPDTTLQMIATEDIGHFAAEAFEHPETYLGRRIEIAGDELTGPQMAEVFQRVCGHPVRFRSQPPAELRALSEEAATMFGWFDTHGFQADLPALRALHPGLITLETWATHHWAPPAG
ncbi:NmrA/HSCARG family protein [Streptomyces sp. NPDC007172]|uniref:NmrA/HSCARG family protein n=1 Tax=Streptomyces sp. NPDC007172 TaxID=3364776 RepID=UPI0036BE97E7